MGLNLLSQPAQALNWNFSYTANNVGGEGIAGTVNAVLTTDGLDYNTTTIYNVSGISGTANGSPISGLWTTALPNGSSTPDNKFQWDGATGILLSDQGIAFYNSASEVNNLYELGGLSNYFDLTTGGAGSSGGNGKNVSASSLTPTAVPWETDALPVIGSTILFAGGVWAKRKFAKPLQK